VVSERPQASVLARTQARAGRLVTNLRHRNVQLEDDLVRRFLQLVDGTRDVDALVAALQAQGPSAGTPGTSASAEGSEPADVTRELVETNLRLLARLGLLAA
jgi:TPP-dependent pyruvate/acetoin dehydrogenase alpha subunit